VSLDLRRRRRRKRRGRLRSEREGEERRGEELRSNTGLTYLIGVAAEVLVSGEGREGGSAGGRTTASCFPVAASLLGAQASGLQTYRSV